MTHDHGVVLARPAALVDLALAGLEEAMYSRGHSKALIDLLVAAARDRAALRLAEEPALDVEVSVQRAWTAVAPVFAGLMAQHGFLPGTVRDVHEEGARNIARVRRYREVTEGPGARPAGDRPDDPRPRE
ncbi:MULTISPECIES: hypothetical protein [Actinomadura]|uniref:Uncharacterized protein n=1 Tax=Actinomadura yumaensis TaxID=111807 RepID=A0ABW2CRZ2_9ACTN|nr:hypothetical protein [Actinomadura sp. J1-007]MWK34144.1 hypothetical protein [Actinomadura sp. J1-007]